MKPTLRTLQIGDDWVNEKPGGLGRYYYELIRHLPLTGTTARGLVVGSPWITEATNGEVVAFARPHDPMPKRLLAARSAALSLIDAGDVDLIATHFALYAFPIADKLRSIPTVVHFQGPWSGESGVEGAAGLNHRMKNAVENVVYSRAKRLLVLSRSFQQELVRRYRIPEELIRVNPGGIDIDRFNMSLSRAEAREQLGWPQDRPILLTVRRQVRRMGLENLIDATKLLVTRHPDLLVLLAGTGPISGELRQRVQDLGLDNSVRLLGRVSDEDLPLAYRAANMSVVPTQLLEGFGLITLESLACGTPVFVTPVGGLPETVEPFSPQCIFADLSTDEMAHVLDEALRGQITIPTEDACRAYAVEGFSWPQIATRVRRVYDEALG